MRKVMTILGTRPELIKMSRVIARLDDLTHHILVHTGQNYAASLNQFFFDDLGIRPPDIVLNVAAGSAAKTIAQVIEQTDEVLAREQPEALMIYGDTNSGLAVIPAKRRKIPVFHMEAGNRCFDQRVPEELNRKVIDHLSDVNMTLTEHARRYLLAEGLPADRVFKVGSHMEEVLFYCRTKIDGSMIVDTLNLVKGRFLLVSAHREENVDSTERLAALVGSLNRISETFDLPVILSTHPRTRDRLDKHPDIPLSTRVQFLEPFGFFDYCKLQLDAYCVISDSGTITEEASLLNFPAVTVRQAHERPEGMDAGVLVMSELEPDKLVDSIRAARTEGYTRRTTGIVPDYLGGDVSNKVVRIVLSYIDPINRLIWHRT